MSGNVVGIRIHYTPPKHSILLSLPTSNNAQGLTNGCAEAWGGAERDGEGEAGSGCMQAGLLVPGMSHMGHRRGTPCPSAPLVLRLYTLLGL